MAPRPLLVATAWAVVACGRSDVLVYDSAGAGESSGGASTGAGGAQGGTGGAAIPGGSGGSSGSGAGVGALGGVGASGGAGASGGVGGAGGTEIDDGGATFTGGTSAVGGAGGEGGASGLGGASGSAGGGFGGAGFGGAGFGGAGFAGLSGAGFGGAAGGGCDPSLVYEGTVRAAENRHLEPLRGVSEIVGDLLIETSTNDLSALECLVRVDGSLAIEGANVVDVDPLSALTSVGESVRIIDNRKLENLVGFSGLRSARVLQIAGNEALSTLEGLGNLTDADSIHLSNNPALESASGLDNLVTAGFVNLTDCAFTDLRGLGSLRSISSVLVLSENAALTTFDGLDALEEVAYLGIGKNPVLEDVGAFFRITTAENIVLYENDSLSDLTPFANPREVNSLFIEYSPALVGLEGLEGLSLVQSDLSIANNAVLRNLGALDGITRVGGAFFVFNNPELPTCEALRLRDHIGVDNLGYYSIFGNDDAGTCP